MSRNQIGDAMIEFTILLMQIAWYEGFSWNTFPTSYASIRMNQMSEREDSQKKHLFLYAGGKEKKKHQNWWEFALPVSDEMHKITP